MRVLMTSWLRGRSDTGAYEARTDVSSFILYAVLTLTVFVTAGYLVGIALLAHFDLLPRRLTTPIHFGGATTISFSKSLARARRLSRSAASIAKRASSCS